ncbi:MAG: hypothetical protein ACREA0_06665, partial [bacterium]
MSQVHTPGRGGDRKPAPPIPGARADPSQLARLLADVASSWAGPAAGGAAAGPLHQQLLYERWLGRPVWR